VTISQVAASEPPILMQFDDGRPTEVFLDTILKETFKKKTLRKLNMEKVQAQSKATRKFIIQCDLSVSSILR
jgi:hypothetical protein